MRKSRFKETQIVKILKSIEGGRRVPGRQVKDVCREHGISDASYYNWKSKFGCVQDSDVKRLKELEEEHRKLKQLYADLSLENQALKDLIEESL